MNAMPGRRKRKKGVEVVAKKGGATTGKRGGEEMTGNGASTGGTRSELERM